MIKNIKVFPNNNPKSIQLAKLIKGKLIKNGFKITDKDYQLCLAIGGDGSFLRMVKDNNFNSHINYIGINTGHLGFLQELKENDIDVFIRELKENKYKVENIGIQETNIYTNKTIKNFYSLNEIVIRSKDLTVAKLDIYFNGDYIGRCIGDGVLVATSTGSTAYNLSLGGSIVYNTFKSLQLTPIACNFNSTYKSLTSSIVVPDKMMIKLRPVNTDNLLIQIDGENNYFDNVSKIKTTMDNKHIKCLRLSHYNFPQKIYEKLLKSD